MLNTFIIQISMSVQMIRSVPNMPHATTPRDFMNVNVTLDIEAMVKCVKTSMNV